MIRNAVLAQSATSFFLQCIQEPKVVAVVVIAQRWQWQQKATDHHDIDDTETSMGGGDLGLRIGSGSARQTEGPATHPAGSGA